MANMQAGAVSIAHEVSLRGCFGGYFFFQAEDGIRDLVRSRGLGDVYKRQDWDKSLATNARATGMLIPMVEPLLKAHAGTALFLSLIHI